MDEKKIPESCTCYYVRKRIDAVNKRIVDCNQHLPLSQTEPTATKIAEVFCLPGIGPVPIYYSKFKTLDPVIQAGVRIHEDEHVMQCKNLGWKRFGDLHKKKEYVLEVPAYQKERDFLDKKFKETCNKR
ncbi:MAG: hypothetical protein HY796_02755 [Elusimicrobia bacterium]|nr:hypothetical protein [Elusimicrobiota bacterium]